MSRTAPSATEPARRRLAELEAALASPALAAAIRRRRRDLRRCLTAADLA
jgi:hypothetical protein